jgi:methionyl-tRNA formyltransferase
MRGVAAILHHEVLPRFQGAQSATWPIYEGSTETGYTMHRTDRRIHTGGIPYQEKMPLQLKPSLGETVNADVYRPYEASVEGLVDVINNFTELAASAKPQAGGRSFTTPTFWQYLRMVRQPRKPYRQGLD